MADHDHGSPPIRVEIALAQPLRDLINAIYLDLQAQKQNPPGNSEVLQRLTQIQTTLGEIKVTQQEMDALLGKIDTTTNHIADNVQTIGTVDQKISDEIDAFIAANPAGTVLTDAQVAQLQSFADRTQATSDASDAQVAVLQAIAAKGAPVVPPPPPAPLVA